ncbi:hypothetical protein GCM10027578_42300 [Spirosoma luteolum]
MQTSSVTADSIRQVLQALLHTDRYAPAEQGGIYRPSAQPITRLGLALEPGPGLSRWVQANGIDGLWLHRPWKLDESMLPPGLPVLFHHLPFDETLTMGDNRWLAEALGDAGPGSSIGQKQGTADTGEPLPARPLGRLVNVTPQPVDALIDRLQNLFGGLDRIMPGQGALVGRLAIVGAMTDALVREASDRGAQLYLTGQYRAAAADAVAQTGLTVVAAGHERSERWGLTVLARLLGQALPALRLVVSEG